MVRRAGLEAWAKANAWSIIVTVLGGIAGIWSGYVTGQNDQIARLTALERDVADLKAMVVRDDNRLNNRRDFMVCAIRNLDQIQDRLDMEPPCELEVEE